MPRAKENEEPKRFVFYIKPDLYRSLRARLVQRGKSVSAWIREKIDAELAK
jgi:hypothetical protein